MEGIENKNNFEDEYPEIFNDPKVLVEKISSLENQIETDKEEIIEDTQELIKELSEDYFEEEPVKKQFNWKLLLIALLSILLLAALGFGLYKLFNKQPALDNIIFESNEVFVKNDFINGIEYGSGEVDTLSLVDNTKYEGFDISANPSKIDTTKIGSYDVEYTISKGNKNKTLSTTFEVVDTQLPKITSNVEKLELVVDEKFDLSSINIEVKDLVDGIFKKVEEIPLKNSDGLYDEGWYTVSSNVDTKKPSTYNVTINATDKNGNNNELIIPVKVTEKVVSTPSVQPNSINQTANSNNNQSNNNSLNNNTENVTHKCQVKVVDKEATEEKKVWVVDSPKKERLTEERWVETKPKVPAITNTIYVIDVQADPENGIAEEGHTETVIITPEIPAEGYYETVVIQEYQDEKGHWEVTPAQKEEFHYEERDC